MPQPARFRRQRRWPQKFTTRPWWQSKTYGALLIVAFLAYEVGPLFVGCGIKGNINNTGERIYHVPGQGYYWLLTRVNLLRGERWFCSEEDARKGGWRKALR
jgi:hypothetical protein